MGRSFLAFVTFSPWLWIPSLLLLFLFPVTLAYVIVVAHAMELNVVIRQGLQYALARGGARLLVASAVVVMAIYVARVAYEPGILRSRLWLLLAELAVVLLLVRLLSERLYQWIDRHFFREAVNTERLLSELSSKVRTILEAGLLLQTVTDTIASALHINRVVALTRQNGDFVPAYALGFGPAVPNVRFSVKGSIAERLARQQQPLRGSAQAIEHAEDKRALDALTAEVLLPMSANDRLLGFLSLGPKRSEAPYSTSDIRLLEAVAVQTGLALENSRLTAEMAREIAHREQLTRELEIAREVQERLFPQEAPSITGLDYAAQCRPAATIGGDYYDFIPLPGGRLGFAIGDVSGKGIPAALLMASLRASLRGLAITHSGTIAEMMSKLNQVIYEASPVDRFATLFYAIFDPASCTFTYVNAAHDAPILLRAATGDLVRLAEAGLMIGGFRSAPYQQVSVTLARGDTLVMFTDGVGEARNAAGEEFGEKRIIESIREAAALPAAALLHSLLCAVESFAAGTQQYDDITPVVVRVGV
jgi:sigma-B regulation protein RsbU (phosphoserine phosphatase)